MKAIRRLSDSAVSHLFVDDATVEITPQCAIINNRKRIIDVNSGTHELVSVPKLEDSSLSQWVSGGVLGFNGSGWFVIDQPNYDAVVAERTSKEAVEQYEASYKQIELERDAALNDEAATVTVNGATFQADPRTIQTLAQSVALFTAIGGTPEGYEWRDVDNVNHPADLSLLVSIGAARAQQINQIWQDSWAAKAALTNPEEDM